jgi:quinoprotein glucose dehydrogenase
LPYAGNTSPLTYMVGGKQYVVIGASTSHDRKARPGSAYIAFALGE